PLRVRCVALIRHRNGVALVSSEILVIGLSHHTAPVEIREKLSVATEAMTSRVAALLRMLPIDEAMLLSTCNRVELWSAADDIESASRALRAYLAEHAAPDQLDNFLYEKAGRDAVSHAFRMTSSLDSMVVGEPQILGQVKGAFGISEGAHATGPLLSSCFQRAFSVAKRVRRETGIAAGR
ncbi:MAG: hypothetical protein KC416_15610, partial [Myxococcales bacterium]|nr:hypothetical protein [Myxococcales bacterium]